METCIGKKVYDICRRKFRIRVSGVSVPSKSSVAER